MNQETRDQNIERIEELLTLCRKSYATDLHLSAGQPPYLRRNSILSTIDGRAAISAAELKAMARSLMNERQWEVFLEKQDIDIAYSPKDGGRFRINVFLQHQGISIAVRRLEDRILDLKDWNLPEDLAGLTEFRDGLVIATGPTGSGKTTTLATLLNLISQRRSCHIITVEDPVEYLFRSDRSLIHQRELYTHVPTFAGAIRSAMREDPDVLLVGEMRDLDTMRAGIIAAETGHLVFSTLHTGDAVGSIERMVGLFPSTEQESIRQQLSMVLRAVIAQKLLLRSDEDGLIPAVELLRVTNAVANLIRTGRSEQIYSLMETGTGVGMRTMEQDLARLVKQGDIPREAGRKASKNVEIFEEWLGMEQKTTAEERRS